VPVEVVDAALGSAHGAGATTVLNQAPFRRLSDTQWGCTDVLVVNEAELDALLVEEADGPTGAATPEGPDGGPGVRAQAVDRAERLLSMRRRAGLPVPACVVVSLGAAGAVVVDPDGGRAEVVAPEVVAVDTVGAGDCLVGWLAAGLLDRPAGSSSVVSALRSAVNAAALSVQRSGAAASMPFAAEVP
jgi:ribokinase